MPKIRVLHLSDLLFGPTPGDAPGVLTDFVRQLNEERFDYLVVAGNLTANASPASFEAAATALRQLAGSVLVKDQTEVRLNRVLIVPGHSDVTEAENGVDFSAFAQFHETFFRREIAGKRMQPFQPNQAILRELKDLRLVGVCCGAPEDSKHQVTGLSGLAGAMRDVCAQLPKLDYAADAITLLITAHAPYGDADLSQLEAFRELQNVFKEGFRVSLRLFGSGPVTCIPREPFTHAPLSIGTGPRAANGFWPFRANILELDRAALSPATGTTDRRLLSIRIVERANAASAWNDESYIDGQLDAFLRKAAVCRPDDDTVYRHLLDRLDLEIRNGKRLVLLRGFPGSGKYKFFQLLSRATRVGAQQVRVINRVWSDAKLFGKQTQEVIREIRKIAKELDGTKSGAPVRILLVIYDSASPTLDIPDKKAIREKLIRELETHFPKHDVATVIFVTKEDYTLGGVPERSTRIDLGALRVDAMRQLVKQYSHEIPVADKHVSPFTGGYAGFTTLLLDDARSEFERWPGSEPLDRDVGWRLVTQAMEGPTLAAEADELYRLLEEQFCGPEICSFIRSRIHHLVETGGMAALEREQPRFDFADLVRWTGKKDHDLRRTLKLLSNYDVLAATSPPDECYVVRLIAPFWVMHALDRYEVFLSFNSKLHQSFAKELGAALEEVAQSRGKRLKVNLFCDHDTEPYLIAEWIGENTKNSENFVLLFEDSDLGSPHVREEFTIWNARWANQILAKKACCVPIYLGANKTVEPPYGANQINIIFRRDRTAAEIAAGIVASLVPKDLPRRIAASTG